MAKLTAKQKSIFRCMLDDAMEGDFQGFVGIVHNEGSTKYSLQICETKTITLPHQ